MAVYDRALADGGTVACAEDPTKHIALYFDYVADSQGTTTSAYLLPKDLSSFANPADFAFDKICDNFPAACPGPLVRLVYAAFRNPVCLGSNDRSTFNKSCADGAAKVADGDYGPAAGWRLPGEVAADNEALPTLSVD